MFHGVIRTQWMAGKASPVGRVYAAWVCLTSPSFLVCLWIEFCAVKIIAMRCNNLTYRSMLIIYATH